MIGRNPSIRLDVDLTNPGQFFACCGLLELADRLWPGAQGCFRGQEFWVVAGDLSLTTVAENLGGDFLAPLEGAVDEKVCALVLRLTAADAASATQMLLNWWQNSAESDGPLKTWGGQQRVTTIAQAMLHRALQVEIDEKWLNRTTITIAPFYFDARRFAHSLDTGFSLDVQNAATFAYPAVEMLALIGLQRFRPRRVAKRRFRYRSWTQMLQPSVAAAVACGVIDGAGDYEFQLLSRDDQDRYKAFGFATSMGDQR